MARILKHGTGLYMFMRQVHEMIEATSKNEQMILTEPKLARECLCVHVSVNIAAV